MRTQPRAVTVVGWNAYVGQEAAEVLNGLDELRDAHTPDAFVINEAKRSNVHVRAWAKKHGYRFHGEHPVKDGAVVSEHGETVVLTRKDTLKVARWWAIAMTVYWFVIRYNRKHAPRRFIGVRLADSWLKALAGVHFATNGPTSPKNGTSVRESLAWARKFLIRRGSRAVVGDVNMTPEGFALWAEEFGATTDGHGPDRAAGRGVKVKAKTLAKHGSDHHAVLFILTPGEVTTPKAPKAHEAADVIRIARGEIGYKEGYSNGHYNNQQKYAPAVGHASGYAWCASFVCWVFKQAGLSDLLATPSAGCDQLAAGFKAAGRWSEYPAVGAVVFYGTPADLSHVGIVVAYTETSVSDISGNTNSDGGREGHSVLPRTRQRTDPYVVGYGYPAYAEGIDSADPAWKGRK